MAAAIERAKKVTVGVTRRDPFLELDKAEAARLRLLGLDP
jgi:hypothetical protein